MIKNQNVVTINKASSMDNLSEIISTNGYCYVWGENDKYLGIIGRTEYCKCLQQNRIVVNTNSKYVIHNSNEYERVKDIFLSNPSIQMIPILDENYNLIYEYLRDKVEENIISLRRMGVTIGEDVLIYDSYIDSKWAFLISIGNHVTISCASILAHDASMHRGIGKVKIGKVIIKDNVFIGYHSIILPNVVIGNKVIIGAGTVVAKSIPDNSVVIGNPMRIIGTYDEYINKEKELSESVIGYDLTDLYSTIPANIQQEMNSEIKNTDVAYIFNR